MVIDKTRIFNSTVEGEKHKCPKCKRQSYVINTELIQVKKGKYEIVIKKRCSFDCPEAVDHKYKLTPIKEKKVDEQRDEDIRATDYVMAKEAGIEQPKEESNLVEEIVEEIIEEEQPESEEMIRNELEHEAQYDEYEAPDDPPEEEEHYHQDDTETEELVKEQEVLDQLEEDSDKPIKIDF